MRYIESPTRFDSNEPSLFLAGGITGCPNWQQELVSKLDNSNLTILNPRRSNFSIRDSDVTQQQIQWEYEHLRKATAISFWFPCETLCPIVLYELGAWSMTKKPIVVGIHPQYQRKQDVEIQIKLARPEVPIVYSLENLAKQILKMSVSWSVHL